LHIRAEAHHTTTELAVEAGSGPQGLDSIEIEMGFAYAGARGIMELKFKP
jgi:hypothetical protein